MATKVVKTVSRTGGQPQNCTQEGPQGQTPLEQSAWLATRYEHILLTRMHAAGARGGWPRNRARQQTSSKARQRHMHTQWHQEKLGSQKGQWRPEMACGCRTRRCWQRRRRVRTADRQQWARPCTLWTKVMSGRGRTNLADLNTGQDRLRECSCDKAVQQTDNVHGGVPELGLFGTMRLQDTRTACLQPRKCTSTHDPTGWSGTRAAQTMHWQGQQGVSSSKHPHRRQGRRGYHLLDPNETASVNCQRHSQTDFECLWGPAKGGTRGVDKRGTGRCGHRL